MSQEAKIVITDFSFYYRSLEALREINLRIRPKEVFALFGPSRSGKTTLLKSLNRLTDLTNTWAGHFTFGYDSCRRSGPTGPSPEPGRSPRPAV